MSFHIQTYKTKYYLVSDGKETDGSLVATIPESEFNPDTTSVMVPPVGEIPVMGTVQSNKVNDLYVGYKSVDEESYLVWTKEAVDWNFASTGDRGQYVINVVNKNLFWCDELDVDTGHRIVLKADKDVQDEAGVFKIILD